MKNIDNNFDATHYCKEMEKSIRTLVDPLKFVASLSRRSLDKIIEKAITEGKKFNEWRESGRPLDNVWVFRKVDDKLIHVKNFGSNQPSNIQPVMTAFDIEYVEGSQLEFWRCDEENRPDFPLFRIRMNRIEENEPFEIRKEIWNDLFVDMRMMRNGNQVLFDLSLDAGEKRAKIAYRSRAREVAAWGRRKGNVNSSNGSWIPESYGEFLRLLAGARMQNTMSFIALILVMMIFPTFYSYERGKQLNSTAGTAECGWSCSITEVIKFKSDKENGMNRNRPQTIEKYISNGDEPLSPLLVTVFLPKTPSNASTVKGVAIS